MNDSSAHVERSGGTSGRRPPESSAFSGERLLTARGVGELFGLSTSTVLDWWEQGRLPGYRLGGRKGGPVRFDADELRQLLSEWRVEARG